ncbi:eukaryotic membrane protein family-domain-containing protein [Phakopsora pachyrhizi]|nr:eukaryotic membrane protein family-domain-containing protein [Phakopsora pachyrhizi]
MIFLPVLIVILSEVLVDWLKHAFITKFNHIRPSVYGRFIDVLCKDLVGNEYYENQSDKDKKLKPFIDKSPAVSRRSKSKDLSLSFKVLLPAGNLLAYLPTTVFKNCLPILSCTSKTAPSDSS